MDTLDKVRQIISLLFNVDVETVTEDSSYENIPQWDSMGQLMLIIELEQQFDRSISPEVGEKLTSVKKIVEELVNPV